MFSATFSKRSRSCKHSFERSGIDRGSKAQSICRMITHVVHPVSERASRVLAHLIKSADLKQVLVFVRTKHGASRLAEQLERDGITATAIHGDKTQPQRTQAPAEFKEGIVRVLVATDVAARGLDIEDLPHVVNFELPTTRGLYPSNRPHWPAGTKGDAIHCSEDYTELVQHRSSQFNSTPR